MNKYNIQISKSINIKQIYNEYLIKRSYNIQSKQLANKKVTNT